MPPRASKGGRSARPASAASASRRRLFLVDAHALLYQSYHALPTMLAPDGRPVQAVYGFLRTLLKILRDEKPDLLGAALDLPDPTFRHAVYPDYKANRPATPPDLHAQGGLVREALDAWGIPVYAAPGFEADDVLATLARQARVQGIDTYLVTPDKDCGQLIDDRTFLYHAPTGRVTDAAAFEKEWGIPPSRMAELLAMAGDPTDNLPGLRGVGPKTAAGLLCRYGTIDAILAHRDEIPARARSALAAGADRLPLWRTLTTLRTDAPVALALDANPPPSLPAPLVSLLDRLGFRSLVGDAPDGSAPPPSVRVRVADTPDALARLASDLSTAGRFSLDTETTGLDPRRADLVGLSFAWDPHEAVYVPVRAPAGEPTLSTKEVAAALGPVLADPRIRKVGQNLKFDLQVLRRAGIDLRGLHGDSMIASHLLRPQARHHDLSTLARDEFGERMTEIDELLGDPPTGTMADVPIARIAPYAGADASVAWRLLERYEPRLASPPLADLYRDVEIPLVSILADMEWHGIRIDTEALAVLSGEVSARMAILERAAHETAGESFNLASPRQLAAILFERLRLPVQKRTATGASTDSDVLEHLATLHPLPGLLLEHRQLAKLRGTYLEALPALVSPETGRVHTTLHQAVTATGRLSSSDPNLQNIPVRTPLGRRIRAAFLPRDKRHRLVCADYSQIELRVLAHLSGDAALRDAFQRGEDVHETIARQLFGPADGPVRDEDRTRAKAVNYSVIYGKTAHTLARDLGVPFADAQGFIDRFFQGYPGVRAYLDRLVSDARRDGEVRTLLGRRRPIPELASARHAERALGERLAVNTTIQGTAADLIKLAMVRVQAALADLRGEARLLLQIHDELLVEAPAGLADEVAQRVERAMAGARALSVPLAVHVGVGIDWLAAAREAKA